MPKDDLVGIAVEGLAPEDQKGAHRATVEIADLVLYYGKRATFENAKSAVIIQFKYSIGSENDPFRASDAKKTISKFATAFRSHKRKYGAKNVREKLRFELITNRPMLKALTAAIQGIGSGTRLKGEAQKQATQFKAACRLKGADLTEFTKKVRMIGLAGNLKNLKQDMSRALADWSAAPDAMARARLGNMRLLLRDKAGSNGEGRNLIRRVDVLAALEVSSPEDLFPCPASFPEVGKVVEREQLSTVANMIPRLSKPLLIHADGGLGKTVFMQSLAGVLGNHEVTLFDCFGGGAYRAPEDGRHLPKRGLVHIVNTLAADGLCDPLLPAGDHVEDLIKAFRARLGQAVATLRRASKDRQLLLFIDAIDNAAEHAKDTGERAFPTLLLESFHHSGPVCGVQLIVSCRPHRRHYFAHVDVEEFQLDAFTEEEAAQYVRDRVPNVRATEVRVAYARSNGNPRILEHLVADRGLLDASELNKRIELDDLLHARIKSALGEAARRGYQESAINAFLAGLSVLPPPVPPQDYADAHGMDVSAVNSFAADLAPLLEQTKHGLMFRDEPTETLVRKTYGTDAKILRVLADNLLGKQAASVYAAAALPGLLQKLDDGQRLFELAFDKRFPSTITSSVGQQKIRYMRLKAATLYAAKNGDFNRLVHLMLELSTLAAIDERGRDYLLDNPDLVIASRDVDATRRLFEFRTSWPGERHARLAIASVLAGDLNDALRHARSAEEWIFHSYRQKDGARRNGPEKLDVAALPLCLIAQNRGQDAARFLASYDDWYTFEVCEHLLTLLARAQATQVIAPQQAKRFFDSLKPHIGSVAAALAFSELNDQPRRQLIEDLAKKAKNTKKALERNTDFQREGDFLIEDGLFKSAAVALSLGLHAQAHAIAAIAPHERPRLWAYVDRMPNQHAFPFITYSAIQAAAQSTSLDAHTILPSELAEIGSRISTGRALDDFRKGIKAELEKQWDSEKGLADDKRALRSSTKRDAERFLDERLEPLLELTEAFRMLLSVTTGKADRPFLVLLEIWERLRKTRSHYTDLDERNVFFDLLGLELLTFSLWSRNDLGYAAVKAFIQKVTQEGVTYAGTLAEIATILSKRPSLHELAGQTAIAAKSLVEREDEVEHRANLFAQLAKAMLPASSEEAAKYFRVGLEQMDAIGSGDYQFTNELMIFASELKGGELEEKDFHTLANICELNMSSDAEKFPWYSFGRGLSRTSGCRGLARLGRWHDRSKVSLDYTLLPYLTALLDHGKIDPRTALALLRLTDPAELYSCGTRELARIIEKKAYPNAREIISELIEQFERNNPGVSMPSTFKALAETAERVFRESSDQAAYLSAAAKWYEQVNDEGNENRNYHGTSDSRLGMPAEDTTVKERAALEKIAAETDPLDEAAFSRAVDLLNEMDHAYQLRDDFLQALRKKVTYSNRAKYVQVVGRLTELNIYAKFEELKACKAQWAGSSASLDDAFDEIGVPLVQIHAEGFVHDDYLSGSRLREVSDLSGIPMPVLVLELISIFATPDSDISAAVWLGLASFICERSDPGEGHAALTRLLNSNAARLSSSVADGAWKEGLYTSSEEAQTAAGLIWLMLGSPEAAERWRAAHSVRSLAKLGKWEIIDALVAKLPSTTAHPFQAPELGFYFLHARLWLLIALARIAMDHADRVAAYTDALKHIAFDKDLPHVLIRHFAAQALLTCMEKGTLRPSSAESKALNAVNVSPFPQKAVREQSGDSFYRARPAEHPKPADDFSLDYDFDKGDIQSLSVIFDVSRWEVRDALTAWVRNFDSTIKTMHDHGGRYVSQRNSMRGLTARHHGYGQQLAWNALLLVAGKFLAKYPVAKSRHSDTSDEWHDWLDRQVLTRKDGLWLADGVDRPPLETQVNLKEKAEKGLVLTGKRDKLLALLRMSGTALGHDLAVGGDWHSDDGIGVYVMSALVSPKQARAMAATLAKEDAFQAWLPSAEGYDNDEEVCMNKRPGCTPWIVRQIRDERLDETDPLTASSVVRRLRFTKKVNTLAALRSEDPFHREWLDADGKVAARSEAWGRNPKYEDGKSQNGHRLVCTTDFLQAVLASKGQELLVLVVLRLYEKGYGDRESRFWHTTGVVHVKRSLEIDFYLGNNNQQHVSRF